MHGQNKSDKVAHSASATSKSIQPQAIEQLVQNGQPQFGVFSQVEQINYLDYRSPLISQKPLANWRKELKANQFCFIQIVQAPYRICLALATIKIATSAFVYLYNNETDELEVCEALRPLMQHSNFTGDHHEGQMVFSHAKLKLTLDFAASHIKVTLNSQYLALTASLQRLNSPLAICTPTGRRGWTFTQKEPLTDIDGELVIKAHSQLASNNQDVAIKLTRTASANLDWTLGYMRHVTNWFWACINSTLSDGRRFMLNLSMGVNETGMSENACWLDGEIVYLPPVLFKRKDLGSLTQHTEPASQEAWHIYHQNLGWSHIDIDLTFTPKKVYQKTDNYGVVASIFEQWLGEYSGEIRMGEEVIKLDKVIGLAEDHFAKW